MLVEMPPPEDVGTDVELKPLHGEVVEVLKQIE